MVHVCGSRESGIMTLINTEDHDDDDDDDSVSSLIDYGDIEIGANGTASMDSGSSSTTTTTTRMMSTGRNSDRSGIFLVERNLIR